MVDIHNHILPFVDDGSKSLTDSITLIKDEIKNGIDKIILTPHNKTSHYEASKEEILTAFDNLNNEINKNNLKAKTYLGQEVYVDDKFYDKLKDGNFISINKTKYVLIEFSYYMETDIIWHVDKIIKLGYIPVIAHIERYVYFDWSTLYDLKMMGALIQVNASSLAGVSGKRMQDIVLSAISEGYIDFVSSDIHVGRKSFMKKAYKKVAKSLGKEAAQDVFELNAIKYFNLD